MKNIYYATKLDTKGNKLTVGYLTSKNRDRYGGASAAKQDTVILADFNSDGKLALYDIEKNSKPKGRILRAMLVNNGTPGGDSAEGGQFVLYGKIAGIWSKTAFNFGDFSAANSAMKTMISSYEALLVRDESDLKEGVNLESEKIYEDIDLSIGE